MLEWTTACPDWERRIVERRSLLPCGPLFPDYAKRAMEGAFQAFRLVDVAGQPTFGEANLPWLTDFAEVFFGAYDDQSGRRLISEFFVLVSKKNAKSTIAAGIMLAALVLNWRPSAEFLILAPTKEAADNAFRPAWDIIKADEALSEIFHVSPHQKIITHQASGATLKVVAADGQTVVGKKATGVLIDELHEFGKKATADNMLLEATGGLASRPEGFVIYLSTQSEEPPAGVFAAKLKYARKVRDGEIDNRRFLPLIYEFPKAILDAKGERNPENFYMTNPNMGASVSEEWLWEKFEQALDEGEEKVRIFLSKHLNVQIGMAMGADRWAGADYWEKQSDPSLTLDELIRRSDLIVGGIDGGGADDFLSLGLLGRNAVTGDWLHWQQSWVFSGVLETRKKEAPRYLDFAAERDLVIGPVMDDQLRELVAIVLLVDRTGKLAMIGLDPAGVADIVLALAEEGIGDDRVVGISQGWKMIGAIKTTERRLVDGTFWHGGRPIMAWAVGNARVVARGNAFNIEKQVAGGKKIDPLMALFDAVAVMALNPKVKKTMESFMRRGLLST
ncbi:terminase large subunit [Gluconacetobacter sp. 1b LMG 1731]|uniref:Terminase large subunit n=1 Tax=Gluconacetobacter dulcium TaxID=2729096 RepID=A0A7W4IK31_9PROT|nr:terminase large subunit [Gluconacetobacter dulcium]MBB2193600.1 terminase large subunit [Gluconacetobacter dulcium]